MYSIIPVKDRKDILEVLDPFSPFDAGMGTYLMLRMTGLSEDQIVKIMEQEVKVGEWLKDSRFADIYNNMKVLACSYGRPARDLRGQYLDALLVECGIALCQTFLKEGKIEKSSWNYLGKIVGLRMPVYAMNPSPVQSGSARLAEIMAPIFNDTGREIVMTQQTRQIAIKAEEAHG